MFQQPLSLYMSLSPETVERPYYFHLTQKRVYSLEEMLYHCYHFWKQSIDDFLVGKLEEWIEKELQLPQIAAKIVWSKSRERSITKQYLAFLTITDYFYPEELTELKRQMLAWEHKAEWEKCKEKGDLLNQQQNVQEAIGWYQKALEYADHYTIFNNMGVAYMKGKQFAEALGCFEKAYDQDPGNSKILFNLIEVLLSMKKYHRAEEYLQKIGQRQKSKDLYYYYGELYRGRGDFSSAEEAFKKAIALGDDFRSYIRLGQLYTDQSNFEQAIQTVQQIPDQQREDYYMEVAYIFEKWGREEQAIQYAKQALAHNDRYIEPWILLAKLHRRRRELDMAQQAIEKALAINPGSESAQLESARIQKAQGRVKDYQFSLKSILKRWIGQYRQQT